MSLFLTLGEQSRTFYQKEKIYGFPKQRKQDDFDLKLRVPSRLIIVLRASIQLDPESLENNTGSYLPPPCIRLFGYSTDKLRDNENGLLWAWAELTATPTGEGNPFMKRNEKRISVSWWRQHNSRKNIGMNNSS
jgi:hypothetical protein